MKRVPAAILTGLCFAVGTASPAIPPPVFVQGASEGQGFLLTKLGQCYVVTAAHVLGTKTAANIIAPGNPVANGEAVLVGADTGRDVAVMHVTGPVSDSCGTDYTRGASLDAITRDSRAVVSVVYSEGGLGREELSTLVSQLDSEYLFLQSSATAPASLMQGLSGGMVGVNDAPAGVLLGVVDHHGKVLRYDLLMNTVFQIFETTGPPRSVAPSRISAANLAFASSGATVVRWSTPPEQPEFATSNLLRPAGPEYWRVPLMKPATVDIRLSGQDTHSINTVELTRGSAPAGQLIKDYEIFTSLDGTTWFYVNRGEFRNEEPQSSITFPPRNARFVRLRVLDSFDPGAKTGALGRISIR